KFLEHNFLLEKLSHVALMLKNSFQRKLTIVKNGGAPLLDVRLEIPSGFVTRKWFSLTIL
ncbi:hypothetical protein HN51_056122, partial [Arachis hypogaea]